MNGTSTLPGLLKLGFWHRNGDSGLTEDDELFIGYGHVPSCFPYKMQDMYSRELKEKEMNGVVLENEYLKAVFLPEWGGKMMSLFDKVEGKDLLYTNPVMRPCNLIEKRHHLSAPFGKENCLEIFILKNYRVHLFILKLTGVHILHLIGEAGCNVAVADEELVVLAKS